MSATPHISIRVNPDQLAEWKNACSEEGVDLSFKVRWLMDAWVRVEKEKQRQEKEAYERQVSSLKEVQRLLESLET